jgi:hypothetical protein
MCTRQHVCSRPGCAERLFRIAKLALCSPSCRPTHRAEAELITSRPCTQRNAATCQTPVLTLVRTPVRERDDLTLLADILGIHHDRRPAKQVLRVVAERGQR